MNEIGGSLIEILAFHLPTAKKNNYTNKNQFADPL